MVSAKLTREKENQKHKKEEELKQELRAKKNSKPKGDLDSLTRPQRAHPHIKQQNRFCENRERQTCDN